MECVFHDSKITNIEMINARNKLKAYKGPAVLCIIQDKYKRTKFLGIEYCKHMIQESNQDDQWLQLFSTSKKKMTWRMLIYRGCMCWV